jgi:hypothetical protein
MEGRNIEHALNLSASRAYDSALEILGAYKLTGNFHINLEIILKDIDAFDKVTFEIEPRSPLPYSSNGRTAQREHSHERVQRNHGLPKRAHRVRRDAPLVGESLSLAASSA